MDTSSDFTPRIVRRIRQSKKRAKDNVVQPCGENYESVAANRDVPCTKSVSSVKLDKNTKDDQQTCTLCGEDIPADKQKTHVIACLKENFANSKGQRGVPYVCPMCKINMEVLKDVDRLSHMNKCADQEAEAKAETLKALEQAKATAMSCPLCGKGFKVVSTKKRHALQCAAGKKVDPPVIDKLLHEQDEQLANLVDTGCVKAPAQKALVKKNTKKDTKTAAPRVGPDYDEEMALAKALSLSLQEHEPDIRKQAFERDKQSTTTVKQGTSRTCIANQGTSSSSSTVPVKPVADAFSLMMAQKAEINSRNRQKKLFDLQKCPLVTNSREDLHNRQLQKLAQIFEQDYDSVTSDCDEIKLPESRLRSTTPAKWSVHTFGSGISKEMFYVNQLRPPIVLDTVPEGSKVQQISKQQLIRAAVPQPVKTGDETMALCTQTALVLARLDDTIKADGSSKQMDETGFIIQEPEAKNGEQMLLSQLEALVDNSHLSDCVILVKDGQPIPSHSFLLQLRAPLLAKIRDNKEIGLRTHSRRVVLCLLQYIYHASLAVPRTCSMEVYQLACRFNLEELKDACKWSGDTEEPEAITKRFLGEREEDGLDAPLEEDGDDELSSVWSSSSEASDIDSDTVAKEEKSADNDTARLDSTMTSYKGRNLSQSQGTNSCMDQSESGGHLIHQSRTSCHVISQSQTSNSVNKLNNQSVVDIVNQSKDSKGTIQKNFLTSDKVGCVVTKCFENTSSDKPANISGTGNIAAVSRCDVPCIVISDDSSEDEVNLGHRNLLSMVSKKHMSPTNIDKEGFNQLVTSDVGGIDTGIQTSASVNKIPCGIVGKDRRSEDKCNEDDSQTLLKAVTPKSNTSPYVTSPGSQDLFDSSLERSKSHDKKRKFSGDRSKVKKLRLSGSSYQVSPVKEQDSLEWQDIVHMDASLTEALDTDIQDSPEIQKPQSQYFTYQGTHGTSNAKSPVNPSPHATEDKPSKRRLFVDVLNDDDFADEPINCGMIGDKYVFTDSSQNEAVITYKRAVLSMERPRDYGSDLTVDGQRQQRDVIMNASLPESSSQEGSVSSQGDGMADVDLDSENSLLCVSPITSGDSSDPSGHTMSLDNSVHSGVIIMSHPTPTIDHHRLSHDSPTTTASGEQQHEGWDGQVEDAVDEYPSELFKEFDISQAGVEQGVLGMQSTDGTQHFMESDWSPINKDCFGVNVEHEAEPYDPPTDVSSVLEESFKTPQRPLKPPGLDKQAPRGTDMAFTPAPPFDCMQTPDLVKACNEFGVRKLPKKRMVKVLKNIYEETHPGASADNPQEKAIKAKTKVKASQKVSKPKSVSLQSVKGGKFHRSLEKENLVIEKEKTMKNKEKLNKNAEDSFSSQEGFGDADEAPLEDTFIDEENEPKLNKRDVAYKKQQIFQFIQSREDLRLKLLHYEPFEFDEFHQELKTWGLNVGNNIVAEFLDEKSIPFTLRMRSKTADGKTVSTWRKPRKPKK